MLQNQKRFKRVNEFCSVFKDSLIPQVWKGLSSKMSGYALFLKMNMPAFGPDGTLQDAKKLMLSIGNLSFPQRLEVRRKEGEENLVEVHWPKEMNVGGLHLKDELLLVSEADGQYSEITSTGITKNDLKGSFALPSSPMPQATVPMHLYLFFTSYDRREYSDSVCFEV